MKSIFFLFFVIIFTATFGQKNEKSVGDYLPTDNLDAKNDANKLSNRPKRKNISLIYISTPRGILYGNPCATDATHRMGFEYIIESRYGPESKTGMGKFFNNFWVKSKLVVTRSPFWKLILNSRIRKCSDQTGDFVG